MSISLVIRGSLSAVFVCIIGSWLRVVLPEAMRVILANGAVLIAIISVSVAGAITLLRLVSSGRLQ